ncbi:UDP-N-acetylmuramoyl-L-alanine--D-glutamate ligase [Bartonella sp. M0177]|uniref:UDP-N-acetylmuramoyl-L-alanine--D-glutamate ligase n=1 Tax=Bartonella sp. M0177 TaxID=2750940 RepID=UPI0018DD446D|nr:UDP-N-acetylmuramoyl-L-alanine--D-glutamate ligase [Bartonella sp. M0177]MBI0003851.1 UDP-N-acetylmuramoyl-L-alanine--D-glutamate ligase [Bartonella sp. M0177]
MIIINSFKNKKVALFGLGGSGVATAKSLLAGGADVLAWDDKMETVERTRAENIPVSDLHNVDWSKISALVLAPGVPLTDPEPHWTVKLAKAAGVEIIGDIELFIRERNAYLEHNKLSDADMPFIAITGTNGKSTTTALINHLLNESGKLSEMGGNIGTAILSLEPFEKNRFYVIECSSFQIDLTPSINPTVGILLNISPDHIDRHGTFAHYCAIKKRLVNGAKTALVAVDDESSTKIYEELLHDHHNVLPVSKDKVLKSGYYAVKDELFSVENGKAEPRLSLSGISSLRGSHNAQNALMALATLDILKIKPVELQRIFASYVGLPHRMQQVRKIGNALYVDDSKATNAEASAPALATFDHIYWIIGGLAKEGGITALKDYFPKIRKAYLIGDAAEDFARTINGAFPISMSGTLEKAVQEAHQDAGKDKAEEVAVLLSPACASYDQFKNYGARGDAFKAFVKAL